MNEKMCSDEVEKKRREVIADLLDRMGVDPPEEDEALFARMRNEAATDAERVFFDTMEWRERREPGYDWLMDGENPARMTLSREFRTQYLLDFATNDGGTFSLAVNGLVELLAVRLRANDCVAEYDTVWDFLRSADYGYVDYDRLDD